MTQSIGSKGSSAAQHLSEDECLDLLHGLLPEERTAPLLRHVRQCAVCEGLLKARAGERERFRAAAERFLGALRARPRTAEETEESPIPLLERVLAGFRRPAVGLPVALGLAALTLAICLKPSSRSPSRTHSISPAWLPPVTEFIEWREGIGDGPSTALSEGLDAYARHDARRAADLLKNVPAAGRLEALRRVYLGSALALDGRLAEAADVMAPILTDGLPEPWGSETRWALWVALTQLKRTESADSLLAILVRESGDVGDRARRVAQDADR